ncbi:UvrD-helicase domain-containing protein [Candidatus Haliotispira prima]|uniref:DNA 3'-5' helicase n=1 Tax=Candidatus Haliotispira prima TaxID=3034016 RepID=A0ABY8MJW7_9SPIO|nr:UvrD-helicase domain-containing protein [Candidatus Haliotispira prima]
MSFPLNPEQQEAVHSTKGPLLIIAGAGSGKTRVITQRVVHLLKQGLDPRNILALTFTNKAAKEMRERIGEDIGGKQARGLTLLTFHSFGMQILQHNAKLLGYSSGFSIYDTVDGMSCLKESAAELKWSADFNTLKQAQSVISRIKTERSDWDEESLPFKALYEEYHRHLKAYNAFDFDDLICKPVRLWAEHPEVLERCRQRYQCVMVDEFQDTSIMQYRMLRQLVSVHRNICCVGDDDQSIYSWRGANFENIRLFETDFPERKEIRLERNYRSTETILDAANAVIRHNQYRKDKNLRPAEESKPEKQDSLIICHFPETDEDEARFVCDTIRKLRSLERVKYDEIGILVRTNGLMRTLESHLLEARMPYVVSGGQSFFQRAEIKDLIAYLRVLQNPDDDVSLLRIINKPNRRIGPKSVEKLRSLAHIRSWSIYETMRDMVMNKDARHPELAESCADFVMLLEELRPQFMSAPSPEVSLSALTKSLIEEIDYWDFLLQQFAERPEGAKRRFDTMQSFCEMLKRWEGYEGRTERTLKSWLARISLITRDDLDDEAEGKISLSTIHAAKGLEFDLVLLCGVEEGLLPHFRSQEEHAYDEEEERRLFYVAVTRAKRWLYLTSCGSRTKNGKQVECQASPFLDEIPTRLTGAEHELSEEDSENMLEQALANLPWLRDSEQD